MSEPCHIHALHGFLGSSADWPLFCGCKKEHFTAYDLLTDLPIVPFEEWSLMFNQGVKTAHNILLGYSLGGRLGLHALLKKPGKWQGAIFVSTHPGLKSAEEKNKRIVADKLWAEKFQRTPWDVLMREWNAQDVFKHDPFPCNREESDFKRESLSQALITWSLGVQEDLSDAIAALEIPILWMAGENDGKFVKLAQELKFKHQKSQLCVVSNSGHRLPFGQPEKFNSIVNKFIQELGSKKS